MVDSEINTADLSLAHFGIFIIGGIRLLCGFIAGALSMVFSDSTYMCIFIGGNRELWGFIAGALSSVFSDSICMFFFIGGKSALWGFIAGALSSVLFYSTYMRLLSKDPSALFYWSYIAYTVSSLDSRKATNRTRVDNMNFMCVKVWDLNDF